MKKLKNYINRFIGRGFEVDISPPDLVVKERGQIHVVRYLVGEEVDYGLNEIDYPRIVRFVETYSNLLERLPPGSEIKVVKHRIDLDKLLSRISNEIMNLKATIDVVEEPHVKQKALVKLQILNNLYENIIRGRDITRVNLVIKIRGRGRDLYTVKQYLGQVSSFIKNMLRKEVGIKVREAGRNEIYSIMRYELGLGEKIGVKTIVVESERVSSITPIPMYKKPLIDRDEGIPLGTDLETGWPVIISLKTIKKHVLILGPTGRGKTTLLASLIEGLVSITDTNVFAIDFKGDLASMVSSHVVDKKSPRDFPINILVKPGFFNTIDWSLAVSDVLSNVLGINHEAIVKILSKTYRYSSGEAYQKIISNREFSILSPIIELLDKEPEYDKFLKYLEKPHIFDLGRYGSAFQNTYGGLLLHMFKKIVLEKGGDYVFVVDEAWRINGLNGLLELVKEGRSRGVGVVLATQNPSDVSREIIENIHLIIMFGSINEDYRREAGKILGLPQSIVNKLSYLDIGEAILLNALDPHPVILRVRPPIKMSRQN